VIAENSIEENLISANSKYSDKP